MSILREARARYGCGLGDALAAGLTPVLMSNCEFVAGGFGIAMCEADGWTSEFFALSDLACVLAAGLSVIGASMLTSRKLFLKTPVGSVASALPSFVFLIRPGFDELVTITRSPFFPKLIFPRASPLPYGLASGFSFVPDLS
ncbi:MAG: hypothetical protein ABJB69_05900 [Spartobacteria bacterium]